MAVRTARYYHIEHRPDENFAEGGGLDLCERCFVGGEIAAEMDPDLFNSFDLVAPLIRAREAWQDIRDREKALMQVAFQEKAAQLAQQRSEAQMAGRLFVGAAEAAKGNERVLVEARFAGASQQASVPRGSRAAILGARSPEQLGEEIMSIIAELRGAAQLSTLLLEVKDRLMVAAVVESSTSVQEKEAESGPLYQMLKSIGVGIAPRRAPHRHRHRVHRHQRRCEARPPNPLLRRDSRLSHLHNHADATEDARRAFLASASAVVT